MTINSPFLMDQKTFDRCPLIDGVVDKMLPPEVPTDPNKLGRYLDIATNLNSACMGEIRAGGNQLYPPFMQ